MIRFDHYDQVPRSVWPWSHFSPYEMRDRKTDKVFVEEAFMNVLEATRLLFGSPMVITSAGRNWGGIAHRKGKAVDVAILGGDALRLVQAGLASGITGFGLRQHGDRDKRFVHLDTLTPQEAAEKHATRPWIWTYQ